MAERSKMFNKQITTHRGKPVDVTSFDDPFQAFVRNLDNIPKKVAIIPAAMVMGTLICGG